MLNFCNEFTFHDHYKNQRDIEINHIPDCVGIVLSKCNHIDENLHIGVLNVIDDTSLMIINGNVENLVHETKNLRVAFYNFCP